VAPAASPITRLILSPDGLDELLVVLAKEGYEVLGPTIENQAIVIGKINRRSDFPQGWGDSQSGGYYRLEKRQDGAYFAFAAPAGTWKKHLFPPRTTLVRSSRTSDTVEVVEVADEVPKRALFGIRGCDLAAVAVQDQVLLAREYPDPIYAARREGLFFVALNCSDPADTCFCTSMGTGPAAGDGADLTLTELAAGDADRHRFVLDVGTKRGQHIAEKVTSARADHADIGSVEVLLDTARSGMQRQMNTEGLPELLRESANHPQWDDVAERCLSCGNCTMACPTCFCVNVVDEPNVASGVDERVRTWGSCFELSHSYVHGGSVRVSTKSRYRQWMTHKLSSWWDQFGSSGCVGCGRCIAWCPVGIDITAEVQAIQDDVLGLADAGKSSGSND
jgi:sulfhydrogenase subunit beta (sulfur reductase)